MVRGDRSDPGFVRGVAGVLAACGVVLAAGVAACITAPPPDLPSTPVGPPTILAGSVFPPLDSFLVEWPAEFYATVRVPSPGETFVCEVVYDYLSPQSPGYLAYQCPVTLALDGGTTLVDATLPVPLGNVCPHRIDFIVANAFTSIHVPDSVGGDMVTWYYAPGGTALGCPTLDAGSGVLPDASIDGLPIPGGDL
jgi:hypothetical protein